MRHHFKLMVVWAVLSIFSACSNKSDFPQVRETASKGWFPLAADEAAGIIYDETDFPVVGIAAEMLADDVERITGNRPELLHHADLNDMPEVPAVLAGTVGRSRIIDELVTRGLVDVSEISGKWESSLITTVRLQGRDKPVLVIAGSDRRGTAYGLTSLSEAI